MNFINILFRLSSFAITFTRKMESTVVRTWTSSSNSYTGITIDMDTGNPDRARNIRL